VVRPSAASLNSLAEVLRAAEPLYRECAFITNSLIGGIEVKTGPTPEDGPIAKGDGWLMKTPPLYTGEY
jgi:hypothetical protein